MKFKKGFSAFEEEEARRKKMMESLRGKLWRFFLKDGEKDAPVRFLTEEPVCFFEHVYKDGARWNNETCIGEGCPHCAEGEKPQWVGAWLVIDGREFDSKVYKDGKDTGTTKVVKDRIKLLVRGMKDVAKLQSKSQKFILMSRQWFVTRTGTGNTTSWDFERADVAEKLTPKELDAIIAQLPKELQKMDFEDLVMLNVDPDAVYPEAQAETKEAATVKAQAGVRPVTRVAKAAEEDEEEEEEIPQEVSKKKILTFKKK